MAHFKMETKNGFSYYEAVSAMQKAIRRCEESEAVFWAIELFESNYISHVWNRLFVIAHEDIGLAEQGFSAKLVGLKQSYDYLEQHRPKKISKRLVFLQTIITFARAKKSRYIDYAYSVYWDQHDEIAQNKEVPYFCYDMHTRIGKAMGKGMDHFYQESAKINNFGEVEGEEEFKEMAKEIDKKPKPPKQDNQSNNQQSERTLFD